MQNPLARESGKRSVQSSSPGVGRGRNCGHRLCPSPPPPQASLPCLPRPEQITLCSLLELSGPRPSQIFPQLVPGYYVYMHTQRACICIHYTCIYISFCFPCQKFLEGRAWVGFALRCPRHLHRADTHKRLWNECGAASIPLTSPGLASGLDSGVPFPQLSGNLKVSRSLSSDK